MAAQFFKGRSFQIAAIIFAAFMVLLVNREFGAADNGDFVRYMGDYASAPIDMKDRSPPALSEAWYARYFDQPSFYWSPAEPGFTQPWFTSATVFWRFGDVLGKYLFSPSVVNIKYIGLPLFLFHFLIVLLLIGRVRPVTPAPALVLAGTFLILTDARITAFYNSFYAEVVPFLALFLLFVFLSCRTWAGQAVPRNWSEQTLYALVLAMLMAAIFAKRQYLYLIVPVLIFGHFYVKTEVRLSRVARTVLLFFFAVLFAGVVGLVTTSQRIDNPSELRASRVTSYHALYFGMLPHSKKQTELLAELGLPAESKALIGRDAWNQASSKLIADNPNLTIKTFLRAIVIDPRAFLGSLWQNAKEVGNFDVDLGMIYGERRQPPPVLITAFSTGFTKVAGAGILLPSLLLACILAVFPVGVPSERRFASRTLSLILLVIIVGDVGISTFDGRQEANKHVMLASLAAALMLVHALSSLVGHWWRPASARATVA